MASSNMRESGRACNWLSEGQAARQHQRQKSRGGELAYQLYRSWSFRRVQLLVRVRSAWAIHVQPIHDSALTLLECWWKSLRGVSCLAESQPLQRSGGTQ
jgi:hypothetical protein